MSGPWPGTTPNSLAAAAGVQPKLSAKDARSASFTEIRVRMKVMVLGGGGGSQARWLRGSAPHQCRCAARAGARHRRCEAWRAHSETGASGW